MKIGDYLKQKRQEMGLSLSGLSKVSGVSKGYLSNLENNHTDNPTLISLEKIAKGLGISASDMLKELEG